MYKKNTQITNVIECKTSKLYKTYTCIQFHFFPVVKLFELTTG